MPARDEAPTPAEHPSPGAGPDGPGGSAPTGAAPGAGPGGPGGADVVVRGRGVVVDYRAASGVVHAVRGVDVAFARGRLGVLAGPSGSGKSSLLRALAGLQRPTAGTVEVAGVDIGRLRAGRRRRLRRRRLGIVLQAPADNLVDYLTAREQVELAAAFRRPGGTGGTGGTDGASGAVDDGDEVGELLALVGLAERAGSLPAQLSGGEQQRVAFAAAAVGGPEVLLADEPTAQLDAAAGATLVRALRALVDRGTTLVVASHDPAVLEAADDLVTLRDGRVAP